jgi:transposase
MSIKTRTRYNEEFKVEGVKLVTERGYSLTQAAKSLSVSVDSISKWKKRLEETSSPRIAFPGNGNMNAIDKEKRILEKEIKKLQIERDILKRRWHILRIHKGKVCIYR